VADAADCAARARGEESRGDLALEYHVEVYGMTLRFLTRDGDPQVLRALWLPENGAWRIVAYDIELP